MADTEQGGAIASREVLTVRDSVITGNMAGLGGGIHIQALGGATMIQNCTVSGNTATLFEGGGIRVVTYSGAAMTILNSSVSGNSASIDGGGLFAITHGSSSLTIQDSAFTGNSASYRGGGIFSRTYGGTTTIQSCTISGNSAIGGNSGGGGGIYSRNFGDTTIRNSTISGNNASFDGGGVYSNNLATGTTTIQNCTLSTNHANRDGGGVWSSNDGVLAIQNCTVTLNTADTDISGTGVGGGIRSVIGTLRAAKHDSCRKHRQQRHRAECLRNGDARYGLVGNNAGSALVEAPVASPDVNGNRIGGPIHGTINPLLGALAANGGSTQTHALLAGSPAIDAGAPTFVAPPDFDQRAAHLSRV